MGGWLELWCWYVVVRQQKVMGWLAPDSVAVGWIKAASLCASEGEVWEGIEEAGGQGRVSQHCWDTMAAGDPQAATWRQPAGLAATPAKRYCGMLGMLCRHPATTKKS